MSAGLKVRKGRSWKRWRRIQIAAQLEARFIPDQEIANHLGITVAGLNVIKNTPEFLLMRTQLATGVLSVYEQARLESDEAKKEELAEMLPMALNSVKAILLDRTHPHHAKVALDLLDRNVATSKISRTQHSVEVVKDPAEQNAKAKELLALLGDESEPPQIIEAGPVAPPQSFDLDEDDEQEQSKKVN